MVDRQHDLRRHNNSETSEDKEVRHPSQKPGIVGLQHVIGNQGVQRYLKSRVLRSVGQPADPDSVDLPSVRGVRLVADSSATSLPLSRQEMDNENTSPQGEIPSVLNLSGKLQHVTKQFDEHLKQYQEGIDDLNLGQVSSTAALLEVDIALLIQYEDEFKKAPDPKAEEIVQAKDSYQAIAERFRKTLGIHVSLQQFQGEAVAGSYTSAIRNDDPLDFLQIETIKNLQVIRDTLQMVDLIQSEEKLSNGTAMQMTKLFETDSGRPINVQFKIAVLKKLGLWDKIMKSHWIFERMFKSISDRAQVNAREFGAFTDVGKFDLGEAKGRLSYGLTDWSIKDEDAMSVAKKIASASRNGREAILKKLDEAGKLDRLMDNLPWKVVEQLHDSIVNVELRTRLFNHYKDEGGGKSLSKMYTETADEYAEEGKWVKAGLVETGHQLHNLVTFGFLDSYSEAYDLREAGLISDDALHSRGALAALRTAALLAAGPVLGKLGQGLGTAAGTAARMSPEAAKLLGAVTGGATAGAGTQLTSDVYNMALMGQEGFSPGSSYLTAAGIGAGFGGLGGLRARAAAANVPPPEGGLPRGDPNWADKAYVIQGGKGATPVSPTSSTGSTAGMAGDGPYLGPGGAAPKLPLPEPVPQPGPMPMPSPVPSPAPKAPGGPTAPNAGGLHAVIGMLGDKLGELFGKSPGKAPSPSDKSGQEDNEDENKPKEIILRLPPQKAPYASWYRSLIGTLVHKPGESRPDDQRDRWISEMRGLVSRQYLDQLDEMGIEVPTQCQVIPNWSKQGDWVRMSVDHRIELQVVPRESMGGYHNIGNWELLDESSNSSSGSRLKTNILEERQRLVQETKNPAWMHLPLRFTKVEVQSGAQGQRWTSEEIMDGDHFQVLIDHLLERANQPGMAEGPTKFGACVRTKKRRSKK